MKFIFSSFLILFLFSTISSLNIEIKGILTNPYRVFKLPPWTSMKVIKAKYKELIMKYHPDKSHGDTREQFELIQTSFEKIKEQRKNEKVDSGEFTFEFAIRMLLKSIVNVIFGFLILYSISYVLYKLQAAMILFLTCQLASFVLLNNIIPHFFKSQYQLTITSLILGFVLLYFVIKIKRRIIRIFKGKSEKPKTN